MNVILPTADSVNDLIALTRLLQQPEKVLRDIASAASHLEELRKEVQAERETLDKMNAQVHADAERVARDREEASVNLTEGKRVIAVARERDAASRQAEDEVKKFVADETRKAMEKVQELTAREAAVSEREATATRLITEAKEAKAKHEKALAGLRSAIPE